MSEELDLAALQPHEVPAAVTKTLENYLKSRGDDVASVDAGYTEAIDSLHSFVLNGGKRVRPVLRLAGMVGSRRPRRPFLPSRGFPGCDEGGECPGTHSSLRTHS